MPLTTPATPTYKTGKAGRIAIGTAYVFISKWSGKLMKTWADATDSSGFDATSSQLWRKQAAGSIAFEGTIEGYYDFNGSSAGIMTAILGDVAVVAEFDYDRTVQFATGLVNIEDFDTGVETEGGTTIGFTCSFKSYGPMTILPTGS